MVIGAPALVEGDGVAVAVGVAAALGVAVDRVDATAVLVVVGLLVVCAPIEPE